MKIRKIGAAALAAALMAGTAITSVTASAEYIVVGSKKVSDSGHQSIGVFNLPEKWTASNRIGGNMWFVETVEKEEQVNMYTHRIAWDITADVITINENGSISFPVNIVDSETNSVVESITGTLFKTEMLFSFPANDSWLDWFSNADKVFVNLYNFDQNGNGIWLDADGNEFPDQNAMFTIDNFTDISWFDANGNRIPKRIVYKSTTDVKGDIDGDGKVTAKDATAILKYVVGLADFEGNSLNNALLTGGKKPTVKDATQILKMVVGLA